MKIDFDIELTFDGKPINLREKYEKELRLSEELVNEHLKDQASLYAFYVVLSELASSEVDRTKLELELIEASLDEFYRIKLLASGEKITDKKISALIVSNKERVKTIERLLTAKKNTGILKGIVRSFEHRKEAIIALASNMRQQMDVDVYIKKKELKKEKY